MSAFRLIDAEKANYPVVVLCRMLGVSKSGYYAWRSRPPSKRSHEDAALTQKIREVHRRSRETYGSPRVHAELRLGLGIVVGHGTVEMLMRRAGLVGLPGRKRRRLVRDTAFASDLVDRNFTRDRPNQLWVTDIKLVAVRTVGACSPTERLAHAIDGSS